MSEVEEHFSYEDYKNIQVIKVSNKNTQGRVTGNYTVEDVKKYIQTKESPESQKKLRNISRTLYHSSGHYRNLINYFSTLYNFHYVVDALDFDIDSNNESKKRAIKSEYRKYIKASESLDIVAHSNLIRFAAYTDGVFYGYARQRKNGYYIQQLDPDFCKISHIDVETGQLGYSFNFSYFNDRDNDIDSFPDEFKTIYSIVKSKKSSDKWEKIDSPNAICIKSTKDLIPLPPFISAFESLLDIAEYKMLDKSKNESENFKFFYMKIPMRTDKDAGKNNLLLDAKFVESFHENVEEVAPENYGILTSPMEITPLQFKNDTTEKDIVKQSVTQYWSDVGISDQIFTSSNPTATTLKYSLAADEATASVVVREIEKWIVEFLKSIIPSPSKKFQLRILDVTRFNKTEYLDNANKLIQYGLPVLNELMAIRGANPASIYMNAYLQNKILNLPELLVPVSTSHTSTTSESGRPEESEENLTDKGQQTRELESNEDT